MRCCGVLAAVALLTIGPPALAQIVTGNFNRPGGLLGVPTMPLDTNVGTRTPTFRTAVTRVELGALVVDSQGRPVRDLEVGDFEVTDGGRPQKILSFTKYQRDATAIPLDAMPREDAAAAAAATNAWTAHSRIFALVIDDLHIDARHAGRARTAARAFVDALDPSDLLLVALTSSPRATTAAFTRDRRRARALIDSFGGLRLVDPTLEMRQSPLATSAPSLGSSNQQRSMRLADAYGTLERIATAARTVTGRRKALVFLSEGSPTGAAAVGSTALTAEATGAMLNAVAAASVADVAIYPVNPAGLDGPTDRMIEGFTRQVAEDGREIAHEDLAGLVAEFLQARNQLRDLAALTGGVSLIDRNDVAPAIDRVLRDANDVYLLAYEPDRVVKGTKVRSVEVRVKRPGVRVHARRGYLAPPAVPKSDGKTGELSPVWQHLLGGIAPEDGLPMFVQAVPVARTDAGTRFALIVETAGGPLVSGLQDAQLPIEQAVVAIDGEGRMGAVTSRSATLKVSPEATRVVAEHGIRTIWNVELAPGDHQVRVATVQPTTGLMGSLYLDLAVAEATAVDPAALAAIVQVQKPTAFIDPAIQALVPPAVQP